MKLTWMDDPARLGKCWDLRNERNELLAYVIKVGDSYAATPYHALFPTRYFATKQEATDHIDALIALET